MESTTEQNQRKIDIADMGEISTLFGVFDENLSVMEEETQTRIRADASGITVEGDPEYLE